MGKAMSNDTSTIIVRALAQGHSRNDIAKMCGVSTRAVTRVSTNLKKHGMPRPPPSGLKQGRPAKLTRNQADALLAWITARNFTFYVKDLVSFLREHHEFSGCDGTVRRGLVRAGFRRKEPYHKSEITVWIPPDHPPQFEVIADEEHKPQPKKASSRSTTERPTNSHQRTSSPVASHNALEAPAAHMITNDQDANAMLDSYPLAYHQHHTAFQAQAPIPPLDPNLYQMHPGHSPPAQVDHFQPQTPQAQVTNHSQQQHDSIPSPVRAPSLPSKTPQTANKEEELQSQLSAMQGEMAKQAEMIKQLQMQLAQNSTHTQSSSLPTSLVIQHVDPALQEQGRQDVQELHDEEMAV